MQTEAALHARDLTASSLSGPNQLLPPEAPPTDSIAQTREDAHPSFDNVVFDGSYLLGPDDNPILLTAGRTRDQQDYGRVMREIDSMSFLTGTDGIRIGAGNVNKRPVLDGVDWSSDDDEFEASDPALTRSLRLVEGMLNVMGTRTSADNPQLLLIDIPFPRARHQCRGFRG